MKPQVRYLMPQPARITLTAANSRLPLMYVVRQRYLKGA